MDSTIQRYIPINTTGDGDGMSEIYKVFGLIDQWNEARGQGVVVPIDKAEEKGVLINWRTHYSRKSRSGF